MTRANLQPLRSILLLSLILSSCVPVKEEARTPLPPAASPTGETPSPTAGVSPSPTVPAQVYLSDLAPVQAHTGLGSLGRGEYPEESGRSGEITAHVRKFPHGLFAHAPSLVTYDLGGRYAGLDFSIMMQQDVNCGDGVIFAVFVDDMLAFVSEPVHALSQPKEFSLDVSGAQWLTLVTSEISNTDCDWSIWGDPVLSAAAGEVAGITPTPNADLPCPSGDSPNSYLFLDCSDIHRIRAQIAAEQGDLRDLWLHLRSTVFNTLTAFPTDYDPQNSGADVIWWGAGNYVLRDVALVYLVTGDGMAGEGLAKFLRLVRENVPGGVMMTHPAHGEVLVQSIVFGYVVARQHGLMTDEEIADYDRFFMRQAEYYENWAMENGNFVSVDSGVNRNTIVGANISAGTIALAFPNEPSMQALLERVRPRLEWQISEWWEVDGGWGENTEWYGYRVMEGLLLLAESLRKASGGDMFTQAYNGRTLGLICGYFLNSMTPEGDVIALNDSGYGQVDPGVFLLCAARTRNTALLFAHLRYLEGRFSAFERDNSRDVTSFETIAWAGLSDETPTEPGFLSLEMTGTGLNVFRSGWDEKAQFLAVQYTSSRIHNEDSFADVYLYDRGPWIVGNGYFFPGQDYQAGHPTDQHSTLGLDYRNQGTPGGTSLAFADLGNTGITAVTHLSYPGLLHTRTILWIKPWHQWLVVDEAELLNSGQHSLQLRWYVRGDVDSRQDNAWVFSRAANLDRLHVTLLPGLEATYTKIERQYPYIEWIVDAVGVLMDLEYPGKPIRLVSSLTSVAGDGDGPAVTRLDEDGGTRITGVRGDENWEWLFHQTGAASSNVGGYEFEGLAACANSRSGTLNGYCLMDGTTLSSAGTLWVLSDLPVYLEADFAAQLVTLRALEPVTVTFIWNQPVQGIRLDGEAIQFDQDAEWTTVSVPAGQHVLTIE
ncbi:MAG: NPCBM/NEW2 domain-containing protein [Chloroflexi bacterium]|nr:NPCBM/NEW2 domain-containing protein [Chloroflexota bacterium]